MKYCIHCGSELEDEDKFCVHCGLSQSSAPEPGCQQEAVGQTSVSPASAAASKKPVNRAVIVLSVGSCRCVGGYRLLGFVHASLFG